MSKHFTKDDYKRAIAIKEAEIETLRDGLRALEIMEQMNGLLHSGPGPLFTGRRTMVDYLSPTHTSILEVVHDHSPMLAGVVMDHLGAELFPHNEPPETRGTKISRWLNELKGKGYIQPDPNNGADRKRFRWIITERGIKHIEGLRAAARTKESVTL